MKTPALTLLAAALLAAQPVLAEEATLAQIDVHAEKDDFDARQTSPSTRLVYGREELDRMNELTVGDYLRRLPSVTFTGPPGTPKDVRLRGMDKGYTEILIDGEPVATGTKERQIQVDRLPLDMVERIELIRAPGADLSNEGMMGAINIVLRDAPKARVTNARLVTGRVFGEKTDKDTWNLSGQYGNAGGDVRWLLNAAVGQRGELKTKSKDETTRANNPANAATARKLEFEDERVTTDTLDFSPRVNIRLSSVDELVFTPWLTRSDEGKAKEVLKSKYNAPYTDGSVIVGDGSKTEAEDKLRETYRLRGEWKRKLAGGGFSLYAAAQQGGEEKDKTALEYSAAGALTKTTLEQDDKDEREWYLGGKWERKLGRHKLGAGLEYKDKSRQDKKSTLENGVPKAGGRSDNFDITEKRWTAWLQDEIELGGGHVLTPGARALRNRQSAVDGLGQSSGGTIQVVTPSLHYLWRVDPRNNLRASLTKTLKPPKFDQLSTVTDTKTGTPSDPDVSGNPNLQPEKAVGLELGWDHFLPRAGGVLGANLFLRDIEGLVEERTELEGARYVKRPQNVGDARVWGLELDARPRMDILGLPELMLRFNYTRLFSEITNATTGQTTRIKDQPPYVYNIGFDWQLPRWDAAWGVNFNYTPRFLKNPTEPTKPDDEAEQKLLDLYVMKRITRDLALRFTASNLLDMAKDKAKYEYNATTGYLTKYTEESEKGGRAIYIALEGKW